MREVSHVANSYKQSHQIGFKFFGPLSNSINDDVYGLALLMVIPVNAPEESLIGERASQESVQVSLVPVDSGKRFLQTIQDFGVDLLHLWINKVLHSRPARKVCS